MKCPPRQLQALKEQIETTEKRRAALRWLTNHELPMVETVKDKYQVEHASAESQVMARDQVAHTLDYVARQLGKDYRERLTDTTGIVAYPGQVDLPADKRELLNQMWVVLVRMREIMTELRLEEMGKDVTKKVP